MRAGNGDSVVDGRRVALKTIAAGGLALAGGVLGAVPTIADSGLLRRRIPSSGELIAAVGLGTYHSFDVADSASPALEQVLARFVALGGQMVDSSPMYGNSEEVVGDLAAKLGLRDRLFLATKVWTRGHAEGIRQMEMSFSRLRTKRLELMQVHNLVDWQVHLPTLREWKQMGRIRYLGVTHYHESAYRELEVVLKGEKPDFVQINYSMAERDAEMRLLPLAQDLGIAVIINRPFAKASLFSQVRGKALPAWAAEFDCASWAQFFLKFILAEPAVTCVIPATGKEHHLEDNIAAGHGRLPDVRQRARMAATLARI
ncbi:Aldo/keto reductase [Candidatus Accumulibacter aalborgensis]|uniref:Aldo/keto reductase n=1 Tax=Candidatus Accumulibacter aalborgensis TaxID=1860102 RepID=A0A1A8XWC8_9PROT|nr:aldo/keto reductase [Candidatus Accumulibacter aalborgensis]SBT08313.1 Aldo/keto reductase [Candidatus Accumulibacter aalborgensis]